MLRPRVMTPFSLVNFEGTPLDSENRLPACWIGNPRYTRPLNQTEEKKWRLLAGLDIEIYIIAFARGIRPLHFTEHAHFYLLSALPVSILRYAEMFLVSPCLLFWLIFRHQVRVIVAQSPYEGAVGALAKHIAALFGKRVALIIENHGDFESVVFIQRKVALAGLYRRLMGITAHYGLRHADLLRVVSIPGEKQFRAYAPHTPIQRFIAWTDSAVFREVNHEKPLSETHDILYMGMLIPRKGVHILIDAFANVAADFPESALWLVGKPENKDYTAELERQVQRLGISSRVKFVGAVSQRELAGYVTRVRVSVLPSFSEGLPRVIIESMLAGTPVIATDVDGIPEVIQDGVNGYLIPPGDVEALVARLTDALNDPDIDMMGQRARAFAEQFFSETAYVEGYRRLLETAIQITPVTSSPESAR